MLTWPTNPESRNLYAWKANINRACRGSADARARRRVDRRGAGAGARHSRHGPRFGDGPRSWSGAVVELLGQSVRTVARSDQRGTFQFSRVADGRYHVSARLIGFVEVGRDVDVTGRDVSLSISLTPISQRLDTVRARAGVTAVYGVGGASAGLHPVADAAIQVIGSQQKERSTAPGIFRGAQERRPALPSRSSRRFRRPFLTVDVPNDHAVETFVLLTPARSRQDRR